MQTHFIRLQIVPFSLVYTHLELNLKEMISLPSSIDQTRSTRMENGLNFQSAALSQESIAYFNSTQKVEELFNL